MDASDHQHQAPEPQWIASVSDVSAQEVNTLQRRISELEEQVRAYETLLDDLPDLFERKFQQRLEPVLERYRVLASESSELRAGQPALVPAETTNILRFPALRIPALLQRRKSA